MQTRKKLSVMTLFLLTWLFLGCSHQKQEEINFTVLGTSDVHGALLPYDLVNDRAYNSSLAQVYSYVKQARENGEVLLLDNGDILQGDPMVYFANFEDPKEEHICAQVMNFMDYDAATIGNHDIEPGHEVYDRLKEEFKFPWLAANAVKSSDGTPYFKPYTIVNKGGAKIAILGLITPAVPQWLPEKIWEGINFLPMVPEAQKWMKVIQEKEKPDFIIGLFHSGVGKKEDGNFEQASLDVAKQVPGFDMIICGHDHRDNLIRIQQEGGKEVLLINPKNKASYIAEVKVAMKWNEQTKSYDKSLTPELVKVKGMAIEPDFEARFKPFFEKVNAYVSRPVGRFMAPINTRESMFGDSPFMDLIHRAQLDLTGADISFAAPLSFNASIDSGNLYVRDLFKLYRFENLLYTMELSGQEIKDFLEYSYKNWFQQMDSADDPMLFIEETPQGAKLSTMFFNYDDAEGIDYSVDLSKPYGERVEITQMSDGTPFDFDKRYKVAINSYRGNGGGGHLTAGAGLSKEELTNRLVNTTSKDLRYYLMKWIEKEQNVSTPCNHNWTVIPEDWHDKAMKREMEVLYE